MLPSRSPAIRSPAGVILFRYGVSILAVAAAVLLMRGLSALTVWDASPALLVAVAVSALYGGMGPGALAVLLAGFVSRDPGVLLAGARPGNTTGGIRAVVADALTAAGVVGTPVDVTVVDQLERTPLGKAPFVRGLKR